MAFKLERSEKKEKKIGDDINRILKKDIALFGASFGDKKKHNFYQEFSVLLNAGVTIKESLVLVIEATKKETDRSFLKVMLADIINGKAFSETVSSSGKFSAYEYHSLRIGEETGTTAIVMHELSVFYERKNEQKRIVVSALTYPAIVMSTAILVVVFMLSYVVPMFEDIFKQNNMELPMITKAIVSVSNYVREFGLFFIFFLIGLFFLTKTLKKNASYLKTMHFLMLKIPVFGTFITKVYLARFTQALALLTASKIPLLNSIQIISKMISFIPIKIALEDVEKSILSGKNLSASMKENKIFDSRIVSLVKVAEETNKTEFVFKQLNEQFSQEVIQQSKIMSTVLEPLIILFVGAIVGILLIAMYLPMFQMSSIVA